MVDAGVEGATIQSGDSDASQGCQAEPRLITVIAIASLSWQYT
jgi:hypothetical protein